MLSGKFEFLNHGGWHGLGAVYHKLFIAFLILWNLCVFWVPSGKFELKG